MNRARSAEVDGSAAEVAADRETIKIHCHFEVGLRPTALCPWLLKLSPINEGGLAVTNLLGHRLAKILGDYRGPTFLYQRLTMPLQRYTEVPFCSTFPPISD